MEKIWNALPTYIPGRLNPHNYNEYQTIEYGSLHRNTLSQKIESIDMLGATRKRKSNGSVLTFDENKVKQFKKTYETESQDIDRAKDAIPTIDILDAKNRKQNHGIQNKKRGKNLTSRSKKRSLKGR